MPSPMGLVRRLPLGAEVQPGGGVHFRVWAPGHDRVALVLEPKPGVGAANPANELGLDAEPGGYFSRLVPTAGSGTRYRFRLGSDSSLYPDLASRFQPDGPHGPSEVVDPSRFRWTDARWRGVSLRGQVVYEMHVGTFTAEGTYRAASHQLEELKRMGITLLELMPVADFPGRFGWGYDGVDLYAPARLYGSPDDLRQFVDAAHRAGLGVILDVVYNHVGPDGAFFRAYAPSFFTNRYENEWGEALNFDGDDSAPVREFFVANAGYWIDEFHFDGLRLDATQTIHDCSREHILGAIARRARASSGGRPIVLIAENESQDSRLVRPLESGGHGLDGLWNDDFHHAAVVALTGHAEAYYSDYCGRPQEFISAAKYGYLYQGQWYHWQRKGRGSPTWGVPPEAFVCCIENHDQVANSGRGARVRTLTSPGRYRAVMALLLLGPWTPMLFQGQEFGSTSPFVYFADHQPELAAAVRRGRADYLTQFPSLSGREVQEGLDDPGGAATFERCRLGFAERARHPEVVALVRDLLALRRTDPSFAAQRPGGVDGAVLGPAAFALRFFGASGHADDRLVLVNLGRDLLLDRCLDPLLAPPDGSSWRIAWSSEDLSYGGSGTPPIADPPMLIRGESALVLADGEP